jgi:hypothetical protein
VNGQIREINERFGHGMGSYDILCECGRGGCLQRIEIPVSAYAEVRADDHRYLVAPGHEWSQADKIVGGGSTYSVVTAERRPERASGALTPLAQSA